MDISLYRTDRQAGQITCGVWPFPMYKRLNSINLNSCWTFFSIWLVKRLFSYFFILLIQINYGESQEKEGNWEKIDNKWLLYGNPYFVLTLIFSHTKSHTQTHKLYFTTQEVLLLLFFSEIQFNPTLQQRSLVQL